MSYYDPITGTVKAGAKPLTPDTDPMGQYGLGQYGAAPSGGGGISPTSPTSGGYANLLTVPGTRPDFYGILNADPLLQQFKAGMGAEGIADRSQLAAARQQALARFGLVPGQDQLNGPLSGSDLYQDVTPETRALAEKNTSEGLSTVGRLNREFERVQANIQDALAARGALRSGATGVALSDLQHDEKTALSDATSQLLDYLSGVQAAYVQSQRQRAQALSQEQAAAAGRIDPSQLAGTPGEQADHLGNGIYVGRTSGRLFNADGSPYYGPDPRGQVQEPSPIGTGFTNPNPAYRTGGTFTASGGGFRSQ